MDMFNVRWILKNNLQGCASYQAPFSVSFIQMLVYQVAQMRTVYLFPQHIKSSNIPSRSSPFILSVCVL